MPSRYDQLIEKIFFDHYESGSDGFMFEREAIREAATYLDMRVPDNVGDVIYSYRYRKPLPVTVRETAEQGSEWIIRPAGIGKYRFSLVSLFSLKPNDALVQTKILDATPGIITRYALGDEQALLAIMRFNRLVDIFTGLTCYSLQNHLRTTVPDMGQVEIDEIYIGVDKRGAHFVIPVQAKGGSDKLGIVQIEQDFALAASKFGGLQCKSVAAQFMKDGVIALFELELVDGRIAIAAEKHYRLVNPSELSDDELLTYSARNTD